VKCNQKKIEKELAEWAYKVLNSRGLKEGKPYFDAIVDDSKDDSTFWEWARKENAPKDQPAPTEPATPEIVDTETGEVK
jgi:hypothetical protein